MVAAVAEGMLEYTLDVVKLEPGDREDSFKARKYFYMVFKVTNNKKGKQSGATPSSNSPLFFSATHICRERDGVIM